MANQPLILADNLADGVVLHPGALLTAGATWGLADAQLATAGHEPWRVADNLRDLTWWTPNDGGERPHLYFQGPAGGTGAPWCSGGATNFAPPGTSRTLGIAFRSTAPMTSSLQTLAYFNGATTLTFYRASGSNKIGFYDGAFKDFGVAAPSDDAWHTFVWVQDGAGGVCNFYLDGVRVGTANVAYSPKAISVSTAWSLWGGITDTQNIAGKGGVVAYYASALSAADVATLHAALLGNGAFPAGLFAKWDPSVGQGTQTLTDTVGGANVTLGTSAAIGTDDPLWGAYYLQIDSGSSVASDTIILDRGHNLRGAVVWLDVSDDPTFAAYTRLGPYTIPAVAGGLPTDATGCLTAEGVWWKTHASTTGRYRRLTIPTRGIGTVPIVTGWCVGASYRLPAYLDAPAAVDYRTKVVHGTTARSRGGVLVKSRPINYAELDLRLQVDGSDYAALDAQVRPLLRYNQPWWFCLDDSNSTLAGLLRPFWLPGDATYDPVANPYHREVRLTLEEVVPALVL